MQINGVEIEETFAEAFGMRGARVTITAENDVWAYEAARAATGFATSVIGCGVEAGIEGESPESVDGRFALDCLFFANSKEDLEKALLVRIGQAIMTTPTAHCFDGGIPECRTRPDVLSKINVGGRLRFFGDGFQMSKQIEGHRYWRIPVMEGEFLVQEEITVAKGIGGGNFLILAESAEAALRAAEQAVKEMRKVRGIILPFPGGVVRSGSKVGSRYRFLTASTNTDYCPVIRGRVETSQLTAAINSVLEIVIDGLTPEAIRLAMNIGIRAAVQVPGVRKITAGNYGGKLGKYHFSLPEILLEAL